MRILSMTATFGKLEHQELVLEPGLNIITAPNEWGKSTWCAFLTTMLYGVDTRAKSTRTALADKERFAPWSGSPMSGRMEILWQGRKITLERRTRGRIPLGEFRAYETESGLPVEELTAANCGQRLLGVERSVFTRAGFIRLSDLPVTKDEALLSRLNSLVTTGDESGDGERLARGLKNLKNRCAYNRSGQLPQAQARRGELEAQLREIGALQDQQQQLKNRLAEVDRRIARLENHRASLRYAAAEADARRVEQARQELEDLCRQASCLEDRCARYPQREQAQWAVEQLEALDQERIALEREVARLKEPPEPARIPSAFRDMSPEQAVNAARSDSARYAGLKKQSAALPVMAVLTVAAVALLALQYWLMAFGCLAAAAFALIAFAVGSARRKRERQQLESRYGSQDPDQWCRSALAYAAEAERSQAARGEYRNLYREMLQRRQQLEEKIERCTGGQELYAGLEKWRTVLSDWDCLEALRQQIRIARSHLQALDAMARVVEPPREETDLTCTEEETRQLLQSAQQEKQQILSRLHQYQGRAEALGDGEELREELARVEQRIVRLEETYQALTLAQRTLEEASADLQRRFAPKISQRARERMARLTAGRYTRLTLGESLSIHAGTAGEDILRDVLWRSDGTADQLYLSLRLAVAESLTPDAPLVLDDALTRFDDVRLKAALELLAEEAETRQVILFTCQTREKALAKQAHLVE